MNSNEPHCNRTKPQDTSHPARENRTRVTGPVPDLAVLSQSPVKHRRPEGTKSEFANGQTVGWIAQTANDGLINVFGQEVS